MPSGGQLAALARATAVTVHLLTGPLLAVDGDNLAHRAYHALPKTMTGVAGLPVNAIVGWTNMLLQVWETERPRAAYIAWDTLGVPTYRHTLWPAYQAGRAFDRELLDQLSELPALARAFGFTSGKQSGYEADDLIAAAVVQETKSGGTSLIFTNDRDSYQLVSEAVTVLSPRKGMAQLARIGPREVAEHFGVAPSQVADFKALAGDPSDNIPGARGIGPKSAASLLRRFGSLEAVLEARGQQGGPDEPERLLLFREVVRLQTEVAVEIPESAPPDWLAGARALRALGVEKLADRIAQRASMLPGL